MSHNVIFLLVRILFAGLLLGIQFYLYRIVLRYLQRSHRFNTYREPLRWIFILLNVPILYVVFGQHIALPRWIVASMMYPYSIWQSATLFTFIVLFLWKIIAFPIRLILGQIRRNSETAPAIPTHGIASSSRSPMFDDTRRRFLQTSGIGLAIYSFGGATLGIIRHDNFEIVRKDILLRALPDKLHGLRIVVLSDIHAGLYMDKSDLDEYVRVVNKLSADLILLPGDFVTNQTIEVYPVCDAFQQFQSRHGIFGCTGNHEYFAEEDIISNELERAGIRMLRNAHEIIEINNEKIALIGVDDTRGKVPLTSRLKLASDNLDSTLPKILLCHKPYEFEEAPRFDIDLMVSGHTHGGQIVFSGSVRRSDYSRFPHLEICSRVVRAGKITALCYERNRHCRIAHPVELPAGNYRPHIARRCTAMISFCWKFIREQRKKSVLAFLLLGIVSLTSLLFPLFLQLMIDHLEHRTQISFSVELIAVGFFAVVLIATCAGYFELRLFHDLGIGLRNSLRIRYFSSLLKNDLMFFQRTPLGELSSSVIEDSAKVQSFFSHVAAPSIQNALFILGCLTMMYLLHPLATGYIVLLFIFLLPPIILISRRVKIAAENSQRALAQSHSIFEQTLLGIAEVLSFNAKDFFKRKYIASLQESQKVEQQAYSYQALITQLLYFIVSFILLFVLYAASSGSIMKEMPLSRLVAFYFYSYTLVMAIFSSGKIFIAAKEISGKLRRMLVMIHENGEEQVDSALPDRAIVHGAIELRDVNFEYENGHSVFQNFNLEIQPGEWLMISGASGSGKSTLAKLIKGLYLPTHGDVFLDGYSTKDFSGSFYRNQIGYVGQETILFNLSIRENILLGRTDVDNAHIEKLLAICCVHPFIDDLPAGIETIVGEHGHALSVGQKNRIAIARALVLNPPILIIDEASTALDVDTERAIWENIFSFRAHRTTIVCTHHHENLPPSVRHLSLDEWKSRSIAQPNLQPESITIAHA